MDDQGGVGGHAVSTGHNLSASSWLDTHFEACRTEYEAMLRSVGIEAGWRVLDAGTGSGGHLPCMADLVGPAGRIVALDIAPENIDIVCQRLAAWDTPCAIDAKVGSLTALPFPDDTFDAVWCGNVLQYFTDDDLLVVLGELRRVVRPGGLVAVKDVDMQLVRLHPAEPFLVAHLSEVSLRDASLGPESRGSLRGRELRRWLERAGLEQVWQRTTMIERWAPLRPVERQLWSDWLAFLAGLAEERGVPEADLEAWRAFKDPDAPGNILNHPELYTCEGQVVAVGRAPSGPASNTPDGAQRGAA
jgi:ubiquinone/menaquinone biosynthesis C-methylase UbiE